MKPPRAVVAIAGLYLLIGVVNCGFQLWPWITGAGLRADAGWVLAVDGLAFVLGVFLLLGHNWARWLAVIWIGGHVVAMALYNRGELIVHAVIFGLIAYALFRAESGRFFRPSSAAPASAA